MDDAVAFRTRARCKDPQEKPSQPRSPSNPRANSQKPSGGRRRLRRVVPSEEHGEELNNNNSPVSESDGDDNGDSVASNQLKSTAEGDGLRRATPRGRARKRCVVSSPSTSSTSDDSDVVIVGDFQSKDRDVVITEPSAKRPRPSEPPKMDGDGAQRGPGQDPEDDLGDDEELRIVGVVGQVVTRDLPHPRPDCAEHRFLRDAAAAESNCRRCEQCYCYVCDVKASECQFWGTGRRERDHANARSHPAWNALRQAARAGDKSLVRREFAAEGPLRMPPGSAQQQQQQQQQRRRAAAPDPLLLAAGHDFLAALLRQPPPPPPPRRRRQEEQQQQQQGAWQRSGGGGVGGALDWILGSGAAAADLDAAAEADVDVFLAALEMLSASGGAGGGGAAAAAAGTSGTAAAGQGQPQTVSQQAAAQVPGGGGGGGASRAAPLQHASAAAAVPPPPGGGGGAVTVTFAPLPGAYRPCQPAAPTLVYGQQPYTGGSGGAAAVAAPQQLQQQPQQQPAYHYAPYHAAQAAAQGAQQQQQQQQQPNAYQYQYPYPYPQHRCNQHHQQPQQAQPQQPFYTWHPQSQLQPQQMLPYSSYPPSTMATVTTAMAPGPGFGALPGYVAYGTTGGGFAIAAGGAAAPPTAAPPPGVGFPQPYSDAVTWTVDAQAGLRLFSIPQQ